MTDSTRNAVVRLVDALNDPDRLYEGEQLAFLMATAFRWGYELRTEEDAPDPLSYRAGHDAGYRQRVAEENAAYPPAPYHLTTTAREDARRVHRSRVGIDVVQPREGDFAGLGDSAVEKLREGWG